MNPFFEQLNELGKNRIPFFFITDFELEKPLVFTDENQMKQAGVYYDFPGHQFLPSPYLQEKKLIKIELNTQIPGFDIYRSKFNIVQRALLRGDSYLTNLTLKIPLETLPGLDEIFQIARAKYKILMQERFISFSPETFIRIQDNRIHTYPMKGTSPVSTDPDGTKLLNNPKELHEHYTIVDLLRNDLAIKGRNVQVVRFRYLEKIRSHGKEIWQTSSEIVADLPENWNAQIGDILQSMLPAGSISGAPKQRTLEIIRQAEGEPRGYYTGVAGYFDGKTLDTAVMIRFVEQNDDKFYYRSGGGITHLSEAKEEYEEIKNKIYVPIA